MEDTWMHDFRKVCTFQLSLVVYPIRTNFMAKNWADLLLLSSVEKDGQYNWKVFPTRHTYATQNLTLWFVSTGTCLSRLSAPLFSLSPSFYSLTLVLFRGTLVCVSVGTGLSIQSHNKVLRRATERTRWLASETFFAHTHTHTLLSQGPSLGLLYPRVTSRHHVTDRNNSNGYTRKMTLTVMCIWTELMSLGGWARLTSRQSATLVNRNQGPRFDFASAPFSLEKLRFMDSVFVTLRLCPPQLITY